VLGDESEKNTILKAKARQVDPEAHGLTTSGYPGFALALSELDPLGQRFVAELIGNAQAPMSVMGAVHGQDPILCHVEFKTLSEPAPDDDDDELSFIDELEQLDSVDDYGDEQTIITGDFDMEDFLVNPEGEQALSPELDLPDLPGQVPPKGQPMPVPTPGQVPTPLPALAHTPMPGQVYTPTPGQVPTPLPALAHTPMPGQVHTPMPGQVHTPMPGQVHTPMPGQVHTPMPGQVHTPMPGQVHTPMPGQVHTPMPGQVHTPMPGQVHTPMPSYPGMPVPTPYPESQATPDYPTISSGYQANNPNYRAAPSASPFGDRADLNAFPSSAKAGRRKNRTAIIAIGATAIALVLGAAYFFLASKDGKQVATNSSSDAGLVVQDSGTPAPTTDSAPLEDVVDGSIEDVVDASVDVAVEPDLDAAPESLCQVSITTEPEGAALFYLGTNLGVTPYKGPIDCMAKAVDIRHPQYETNQAKFEIVDGVGSAALVRLRRPSFWVTINSVPDNASLKIDGEFIGKTPFSFPLPGFEWTSITISRKGFASEIIDILPTEPKSAINLKLKR
jgi:hypothetical protein